MQVALGRGGDVLDADLEADRRLAVRKVLEGEDRRGALHHPDHPRGGEDSRPDRAADIGEQAVLDHELVGALDPGLEGHPTIPIPPETPRISPVT